MPVCCIDHSPNILSAAEKQQLAKSITSVYVSIGLPAFYVQVRFTEYNAGTAFIGGKIHGKLAGIAIHHIACVFKVMKPRFLLRGNEVVNPVFEPKDMN